LKTSDWAIIFFSIIIVLSIVVLIPQAEAIKGKGVASTPINSNKVCGDQICDEKMSAEQIIKQYLDELRKKQEDERAFGQGRFQIGGVVAQARSPPPCQTIENPSPASGDYFGGVIDANTKWIAVSAAGDNTGASQTGIVYVFDAITCNLIQTIQNPEPDDFERFGESLALLSGDKIAVGTPRESSIATNSGAVYIFEILSGNLLLTIDNSLPDQNDWFGFSVLEHGGKLLVGAPGVDVVETDIGAMYVYDANTVIPTGTVQGLPYDGSKLGIALGTFGNFLISSLPGAPVLSTDEGQVWVGDIAQVPIAELKSPTPEPGDQFGLAVGSVGNYVIVGEPTDRTNIGGTAYSFDASGNLVATLNNPSPGHGHFGGAIVGYDQECVAIADHIDDRGSSTTNQGSVYIFNARTGDLIKTIQPPATNTLYPYIQVGRSLATTDSSLVIGMPRDFVSTGEDGRVILEPLVPCVDGDGGGTGGGPGGGGTIGLDLHWDTTYFQLADFFANPLSSVTVGQQFQIFKKITNTGTVDSPAFVYRTEVFDSNNQIVFSQDRNSSVIPAGQQAIIAEILTLNKADNYAVVFTVDVQNQVTESNESNQIDTNSFAVSPSGIPTLTLELDQQVYFETDKAEITGIDRSKNVDIHQQESFPVEVYSSASPHLRLQVIVTETGTDTGIFTEKVLVGSVALVGENIVVEYAGLTDSASVVSLPLPVMSFDKKSYDPLELVTVNLISHFDNDPSKIDTGSVNVNSPSNPTGITITVQETSQNSAIFKSQQFQIPPFAVSDGVMTATFTDSGGNAVSDTASIVSNRPIDIILGKTNYDEKDTVKVTITDDGSNKDSTFVERVTYTAWSTSNPTPIQLDAIERGKDSGKFEHFWPVIGLAKNGDTIFVKYATESDSATVSTQTIQPTLAITSVELVGTQGNVITQVNKGTIANVKVVLQNPSVIDVYLQVSLQDSSLQPISASSISMQLPSGTSEFVLSTVIPTWATSGQGEIIANVLTAHPALGGYPLVPSTTINFTIV